MSTDAPLGTEEPNPLEVYAALWREAERTTGILDATPGALEAMADVDVGETPSEVVYTENKLALHRYDPPGGARFDLPIFVVYALINRPYILDLQPDRSVVGQFLDAGFTVYLIDWGEPSPLDASLGLEDYVLRYMDNCVDAARADAGVDHLNVLGYCMGGTMSAMYAACFPEKVNTLGLMAAGLCFDDSGGILERWGGEDAFDPVAVTDTYGNVPSAFLDIGFALMDPVDNFVTKYVTLADNLEDEDFVENFARMERWLGDGIDVAGRAFVQFIEWIYQENRLQRDALELDGRPVDLARIDMPMVQIVGEYDHLIPPTASVPFDDVVGSDDTTTMRCATGHIGLSVSSRAHAELWPDVTAWYAARSGAPGRALEDVAGVGPAYASALREAGIEDAAALAGADVDDLAAATGIPRARLATIVDDARGD